MRGDRFTVWTWDRHHQMACASSPSAIYTQCYIVPQHDDTADISDLEAQDRIRHIPINRNQSEVGFEVDFADSVTVEIQLFNADLVQAD